MDIVLLVPLVRRDIGTRNSWLVAIATFLALAAGWLLALYGAVLGLIAAVLAYAVARSRIGAVRALLAAGGSYLVVILGSTVLLYASLETI
ncbi:hypothetical protein ACIBFB_10280 [Nocardiopsis sp. NPDC050513]|uniref:hypothetical protein n=1 Tax=Nocardiopsis sp. NPDC050513 TaxID=3364338 RepID=UPI0037909BF4